MLFNSYEFIFIFLPVTLIGFFSIGKRGHHRIAIIWLVGASLFFYGWWNPAYLGLIIASILFNYAVGITLSSRKAGIKGKATLAIGIMANLTLLAYFKYANFFIDNLNIVTGNHFHLETIILPLAISFFTFQQIAYLVDASRHETREYSFIHYCLFVTFFPQLIAGPIVHHKEILPQFAKDFIYKINARHLAIGISIFSIGLFKKVVFADGLSGYASPVFQAAAEGVEPTFILAWQAALAYTLQLYFDFSGYSDMAIGLARMFGIRLPLNFNSPYKANNIIDFWRRWHITLSRFLRDYLYIPLGGNQKGEPRRFANIMITMLLGGLWHGAGWNFILWGGLHGVYLSINHAWRSFFSLNNSRNYFMRGLGWLLTFTAIVFAWIPFRAESLNATFTIWQAMLDINNFTQPEYHQNKAIKYIFGTLLIVLLVPSTQQMFYRYRPAIETYIGEIKKPKWKWMQWRPTVLWSLIVIILTIYSIFSMSKPSEFLYFQF